MQTLENISEMNGHFQFLLSDVDGTLTAPSHGISERTLAAITKLRANGVRFSIASSRPPLGMRSLVQKLGLDIPLAAFNGGLILRPDLTVVDEHQLDPAIVRAVVADLRAHGISPWIYRGTEWWVTDRQGTRVQREADNVGFEPFVTDDLDSKAEGAIKVTGVSMDPELVLKAEKDLQARWGGRAQVSRSHPAYLDVTHLKANKGTALARIAELTGVSLERSAAIGDMTNDLDMFKVAGFSVAMGNAAPHVKEKASVVTLSNSEEGFAEAVERWLLPK